MAHPLLLPYCAGAGAEGAEGARDAGGWNRQDKEAEAAELKRMIVVLKEQLAAANGRLVEVHRKSDGA